jgi:beta-glucanase (GH16 family)
MYDQNIISASNGLMNIRLHTGADGKPRAAVPFPLINGSGAGIDQLYGRYEVRFRADEIDGYKTAFLLWPQSETWPRDGEIDFAEGDLNGTIGGFVHHQGGTYGGDQDGYSTSARYSPWHTATIEWSPTSVKFILDGQVIGNSTTRVPNTPMHWVLQTETCLDGCAIPANVSGNVQFDYVKVWKYDPTVVVN